LEGAIIYKGQDRGVIQPNKGVFWATLAIYLGKSCGFFHTGELEFVGSILGKGVKLEKKYLGGTSLESLC